VLLAVPLCSQGEEKQKPQCNAHSRGKLWPEKTGRGAAVPVEICAPKGWRYAWQQLTVDVSQLKAAAKQKQVVAGLHTQSVAPKEPDE
jgi:hypothetical protein